MEEVREAQSENLPTQSTSDSPVQQPPKQKVSFPTSKEVKRRKRKINKKLIFIAVGVLIVGAVLGYLVLGNGGDESKDDISPTPIVFEGDGEDREPTSTPEPVDREDVSIEILNGTGIAKEASFLNDALADLGYTDIEVDNADEQDNEDAIATFSTSLAESIEDEITTELKKIYKKVNVRSSSSLDVDVQVITGLRGGQSLPTPTPKITSTPAPTASPSATPTP